MPPLAERFHQQRKLSDFPSPKRNVVSGYCWAEGEHTEVPDNMRHDQTIINLKFKGAFYLESEGGKNLGEINE